MNTLFQQLQGQQQQQQMNPNQRFPSLKNNLNMIQNLLGSSNPADLVQNMAKNNPKLQNVINAYQSSGMTPKQFFYNYAQSQGINPDQFLKS